MCKRYAIFTVRFNPLVGGVEKFSERLAIELAAMGNEVVIVTSAIDMPDGVWSFAEHISVMRLPCFSLMQGRLPVTRRNRRYKQLVNELTGFEIDRVLVNNRFYPHSLEGLRFAKAIGKVPVMLDHGTAHLMLGSSKFLDWVIRRYEHAITSRTKRYRPVYCGISLKSAEWLQHFDIKTNHVVSNAIDWKEFASRSSERDFKSEISASNAPLITFIGRIAPEKGPDCVVAAAREFESDGIQFILAGDGPLRHDLEVSSPANVHFVGILDSFDISALLQQSDAFLLPTRSEGFCTSLLEASACSIPSIIPDVGGVSELIPDSSCGIILPDNSVGSVVCGIREVLSMGAAGRIAMGERARAVVANDHGWKETANTLRILFDEIESSITM